MLVESLARLKRLDGYDGVHFFEPPGVLVQGHGLYV